MKIGERGQVTHSQEISQPFRPSAGGGRGIYRTGRAAYLEKAGRKPHPIEKFVGVLKGRGLRSDDLVEAMRGR